MEQHSPAVLIVGVITPHNVMVDIPAYFEEFKNLIKTNEVTPVAEFFCKIRTIDSGTFFSKGKLEEIKKICFEKNIDHLVVSEPLSPHQEYRLEKETGTSVFDRTALILEIFEKHSHTAEAKLQTKIAQLTYKKTRVAGRGTSFSQQSGYIGGKGPGETQKEIDLQHIDHLLLKLQREVKKLSTVRATQRKKRSKSTTQKHIVLVGYTNAGKSTLFNSLTHEQVLAEDRLFATLDTTTRKLFIEKKNFGTIADTIGFIQNLPLQLIDAFTATLEEITYADYLLHVIDVSNRDWPLQKKVVEDIVKKIGIKKECMVILVFNKIDTVSPIILAEIQKKYEEVPHVFTQANEREGIQSLISLLHAQVS